MDDSAFWDLVQRCYERNPSDPRRRARLLGGKLRALPPAEILSFRDHWLRANRRAYVWPLRDAACVLYGHCDDAEFADLRDWLVSHGEPTLERIIEDPDRLVELDLDEAAVFSGAYGNLAERVHAEVAGLDGLLAGPPAAGPAPTVNAPGEDGIGPTGPRVNLHDEAAVRARFPLLSATNDAVRALMASVFPTVEAAGECPRCGDALTRHVISRGGRDADDAREVARCGTCRALAWRRVGEDRWSRGPDDAELQRRFDDLELHAR